MTTISSALSLVDTVGAAAVRQSPSIAAVGESGFDAIFARALEQPEQRPTSTRPDTGEARPDDRMASTSGDRRIGDRRIDDRRSTSVDDDPADGVEQSSSSEQVGRDAEVRADATEDEPRDRDAMAVQVPVQVLPAQLVVAAAPATTPSVSPGVVTDASAATPVASASSTVPSEPALPSVAAGEPAAGGDLSAPALGAAGQQSIAVADGAAADVVATVQAYVGVADAVAVDAASATSGTGSAALDAAVADAGDSAADDSTAAPARTAADPQVVTTTAPPAAGEQPSGDPTAGQGGQPQTAPQTAPTSIEAAAEVVVDAAPAAPIVSATTAATGDDAAPTTPTGDARPGVAPVSATSASAPTVAERVEAATVRTPEADGQRGPDGTRLRDRFVGNGLGGTMTVDLSEEGLGQLSLQAHQGSGGLHVTLAAGESATRDLLLSQSSSLRAELESLGTVGSLDVTDSLAGGDNGRSQSGDGRASGAGDRSGDGGRNGRSDRPGAGPGSRPGVGATRTAGARTTSSTGLDLLI